MVISSSSSSSSSLANPRLARSETRSYIYTAELIEILEKMIGFGQTKARFATVCTTWGTTAKTTILGLGAVVYGVVSVVTLYRVSVVVNGRACDSSIIVVLVDSLSIRRESLPTTCSLSRPRVETE